MKSKHVAIYTGIMLMFTIMLQSLRVFFPSLAIIAVGPFNAAQLLTGTLVNMCLLITAWNVGFVSSLILSLAAPIAAFAFAQMLPFPHLMAVIAVGNIVYCLIAWVPYATKLTRTVLTIIAAFAKFGAISALVFYVLIPVFLTDSGTVLAPDFTWTQLITAVCGGLLALLIAPKLPRLTQ